MWRAHGDQHRMFERRKIAALAKFEFLLKIPGEIMVPRKLNRRTKWRVSLYKNLTGCFSTSGAPGNLCEKLERAFPCAKIRQVQREIGIDDSHQRHIRKMETLRDHLRSDEDIDIARAEISQSLSIGFLARHRVCIHATHHSFWKNL